MRFDRFKRLIGKENLASLFHKTVAIFGLGGVGSYVVEGIARSGVGKIIICDFDTIELTNINRQLFALDSTVGMYKQKLQKSEYSILILLRLFWHSLLKRIRPLF